MYSLFYLLNVTIWFCDSVPVQSPHIYDSQTLFILIDINISKSVLKTSCYEMNTY
jgi:hypothetical protein